MGKILLDIDGVMITTPPWKRMELLDGNFPAFNELGVKSLNNILTATHAIVVLTTSHKWNYTLA